MIVCHFSSVSFDGQYFSYIGKGLQDLGVSQCFVTLAEAEPSEWMAGIDRSDFLSFGDPSRLNYPATIARLSGFLKRHKVDILNTHLFDATILGLFAAKLAGTPIRVVARHYLDETHLLGTRLHWTLDKWADESADCVIVPSNATKQFMIDAEGQSADNVRVIPYGFDFDAFSASEEDRQRVRGEFGFNDHFVIGCVGRLFKNKGHIYLLEALPEIIREFPQVRLLLLGSGEREPIDDAISRLGLENYVTFAGYRKDVPACMKAMDLLVHPSLSESFGQVIVEAMAVGTPVVVTSVGGVPEITTDQETGLVVEPRNVSALREAILFMLRNPAERERFAVAGQTAVHAKFNKDRLIQEYWKCFQELFNNQ